MDKTISSINERILDGEAVVLTAAELKEMVLEGDVPSHEDVDVVTTGTCGVMSGTAAVMHFRVSELVHSERPLQYTLTESLPILDHVPMRTWVRLTFSSMAPATASMTLTMVVDSSWGTYSGGLRSRSP